MAENFNIDKWLEERSKEREDERFIEEFSAYQAVFDETSMAYSENEEYNGLFLQSCEALANNALRRKGYIFLNEVYDMLGIARTAVGQVVGWTYNEKHPLGDNRVVFKTYKVDGEDYTVIDFNVDGIILQHV